MLCVPCWSGFSPHLFKRKVAGGKKGEELFTTLWDPHFSISFLLVRFRGNSSPIPIHACPGPDTVLFRFFAMLFRDGLYRSCWILKKLQHTLPHWGGCSMIPYNDTLLIPLAGLLVRARSPGWNAQYALASTAQELPTFLGRILPHFSQSLSDFSLPQQFLLPRNSEPLCSIKGIHSPDT